MVYITTDMDPMLVKVAIVAVAGLVIWAAATLVILVLSQDRIAADVKKVLETKETLEHDVEVAAVVKFLKEFEADPNAFNNLGAYADEVLAGVLLYRINSHSNLLKTLQDDLADDEEMNCYKGYLDMARARILKVTTELEALRLAMHNLSASRVHSVE